MERTFLKTVLFLAPAYIPVIIIGGFFGWMGLVIGFVISVIICILILRYLDKIVFWLYRAKPALPEESSGMREILWKLSHTAGIPAPVIFTTELPLPGSFIIGKKPDKTVLIFPARLRSLLGNDELEAVLSHNIVQIDRNIRLKTLVVILTGLMTMAVSVVRWGTVFTGFGDYSDPAPKLFGLFTMGLAAPPAAAIINSVTKKDHDAEAAALCKKPYALISAIERLESNNVAGYSSLGFVCLVDPEREYFFEYLFNIHPPRERRIKKLTEKGENNDRITS